MKPEVGPTQRELARVLSICNATVLLPPTAQWVFSYVSEASLQKTGISQ